MLIGACVSAGWGHKPKLPHQKTEVKVEHTFKREHLQFRLAQQTTHGVDIQETITSNNTVLKKVQEIMQLRIRATGYGQLPRP